MISILGILASIAIVNFGGTLKNFERKVCDYNKKAIKKYYEITLVDEREIHSDDAFKDYLITNKISCPGGGTYKYISGKVYCSFHDHEDKSDEEIEEPSIPYL